MKKKVKIIIFGIDKLEERHPEKCKMVNEAWPILIDRLGLDPPPELLFYRKMRTEGIFSVLSRSYGYKNDNKEIFFNDLIEIKTNCLGMAAINKTIYVGVDHGGIIDTLAHEAWHQYQAKEGKKNFSEWDCRQFAQEFCIKFNHFYYTDKAYEKINLDIPEIKASWDDV